MSFMILGQTNGKTDIKEGTIEHIFLNLIEKRTKLGQIEDENQCSCKSAFFKKINFLNFLSIRLN